MRLLLFCQNQNMAECIGLNPAEYNGPDLVECIILRISLKD